MSENTSYSTKVLVITKTGLFYIVFWILSTPLSPHPHVGGDPVNNVFL